MKRLQNNRYFSLGTMLLVVISICMVLLAIILNLQEVGSVIGTITGAFRPVVVGLVFAYLLNPLMKFLDGRLYPFLLKKKMKFQKMNSGMKERTELSGQHDSILCAVRFRRQWQQH